MANIWYSGKAIWSIFATAMWCDTLICSVQLPWKRMMVHIVPSSVRGFNNLCNSEAPVCMAIFFSATRCDFILTDTWIHKIVGCAVPRICTCFPHLCIQHGIRVAMSRKWIIRLFFFDSTLIGEAYWDLVQQFIALLDHLEWNAWFQVGNAQSHMTKIQFFFFTKFFSEFICIGPPQSLISCGDTSRTGYIERL